MTFLTATGVTATWDFKFFKFYWGTYCDALFNCLQLSVFLPITFHMDETQTNTHLAMLKANGLRLKLRMQK